jgi:hypothetical protein
MGLNVVHSSTIIPPKDSIKDFILFLADGGKGPKRIRGGGWGEEEQIWNTYSLPFECFNKIAMREEEISLFFW